MSDISALEGRITAALDRIRQGIEGKGAGDPDLGAALARERKTNAELIAGARALKDRQDAEIATLTERVEAQRAQMAKLDAELQRLRASNVQMREVNTQLREAVTQGLAPELVDQALSAEIEALHAQRSADAAEISAVLTALEPLMKETSNATG